MRLFIGGRDPRGEPLPFTQELLQELADSWETHSRVPTGVADQLTVSRRLFVHSFHAYEFATVAVAWSLFAVEAALRVKLAAGTSASLKQLVNRALQEGLVAQRFAEQLEAARLLRNSFSHAATQSIWTYGMVVPARAVSHEVVADVYVQSSADTR
ncbi:hypothetical protein [Terrabacter sp. NPDC080008]|uniref:hypothetical protein n=1 Tax=Terrabacter sp. NPDC080008 TaxID=3155176 RepID=UPI00344BAF65